VTIFFSLHEKKVIASVVVFELTKKVVHDFYIAQDYAHASLNPLIGLFIFIFDYYRDRGYDFFNFGISSRGKWIKWGILEFKEQFGTDIVTRDTWKLSDLSGEWPDDGEPRG
jgi:lipid II:glycine glycyltransferase (peptidoglycan interpeptide bridge formation enzyme)